MPFFLYLTYRVGKVRREVSTETQKSLAEMTATTEETLSVSGILLSKTFGQQANSIDQVPRPSTSGSPRSRSARRWSGAGSS